MDRAKKLWQVFKERFQDTGLKKGTFSAPGRVNLIGEHTDYNDGFVLPMAIDKTIMMAAQLRDDRQVVAYDLNYEPQVSFSLDNLVPVKENKWINYLMGVAKEIEKDHHLKGMNIVLEGEVPQGSGLSSSAALEVVTAFTITNLNNIEIEPVEMALLCQRAENDFVGVNCGIMDQYISRLGKKDHALMIDCRTNEYELIPLKDDNYRIVICNSRVERGLVDSEYNQRREECNKAAAFFADKLDHRIKALRDVSIAEFNQFGSELADTVFKRARHIIAENSRVLTSIAALKEGDYQTFGKLMIESHISLRDDYEVSCKELDLLVNLALEQPGVLGTRMTGAGFGGCTVNLVEKDVVDKFVSQVGRQYQEKTGIKPEIYVSIPAAGAEIIREEGQDK